MFDYAFMRTAFAAAGVVGLLAGTIGYFLVLRQQSFASHALAHVGFTGAAGALLLGAPPLVGMLAATVLAGAGMGALGEALAGRDVAIGMVLAASLAAGLLLLHFFSGSAAATTSLLFGNIFAVAPGTVRLLAGLAACSLASLALLSRPLVFASLEPELAEASGARLRLVSVLFMSLVALATAECAELVGVLLVFVLTVAPAAAAQRMTARVLPGIGLAAGLAVGAAWAGLALAYVTDWPPSVWITAVSTGLYAASFLFGK